MPLHQIASLPSSRWVDLAQYLYLSIFFAQSSKLLRHCIRALNQNLASTCSEWCALGSSFLSKLEHYNKNICSSFVCFQFQVSGEQRGRREQKVNDKLYSFGNYLAKKFSALIWLLNPLVACSCYTLWQHLIAIYSLDKFVVCDVDQNFWFRKLIIISIHLLWLLSIGPLR